MYIQTRNTEFWIKLFFLIARQIRDQRFRRSIDEIKIRAFQELKEQVNVLIDWFDTAAALATETLTFGPAKLL